MSNTNRDVGLRMRDDIVAGVLPFGARITIDALAIRYGTSHMPIREALRELQGEGLVVIEPNRGARVRNIDADFVTNLFEIRTALEVMLARRAAQNCTPRDIAGLEVIESALEANIARGDYPGAIAENHRLHQAINLVAGNADALPIIDRHWVLLAALWRAHGYGEARFAGVANDHRNLIGALAAHDQEAASAIMGAHAAKAKLELMRRIAAHDAGIVEARRRRA
jgi:DNA-binding GntR family transcriptional regulator